MPRLLADLERRPEPVAAAARSMLVDDGSTDGTAGGRRAPMPGPCRSRSSCAAGRNRGPGRAFDRGFRRALELCGERRPRHHAGVGHHERPRRARARCSRRARDGADVVLASPARRRASCSTSRAPPALSPRRLVRDPPRLPGSTPAPCPRSSASTARGALRAGYDRHGDEFIRERGFACKAEILIKLDALGRHGRRGAGRPRRPHAATARASCACSPTVARLRARSMAPLSATGERRGHGSRRRGRPTSARASRIVGGGLLGLTAAYRLTRRRASGRPSTSARASSAASPRRRTLDGIPVDRFYHVGAAHRRPRHRASPTSSAWPTASASAAPASASTTTAAWPRCPR